ncbi:MAG: hypothetical protein RLZZ400_327 [Actinomycetota bacterium]|jgi:hypothetical protein
MLPNGWQGVVETVVVLIALGLIVAFALWTSGTNKRKSK